MTRTDRAGQWLIAAVLLGWALALGYQLKFKDPLLLGDFSYLYTGSQCLRDGCDPYSAVALNHERALHGFAASFGATPPPPVPPEAAVYPPSALLVVAPFAGLPWPAAGVAFDCVAGLAFAVAVLWMAWRFGRGQPLGVSLMLSAMSLILALGTSVREALVFGNPSLLAIALAAIGILFCTRSASAEASRVAGALCLGVAVALKPQLTLVAVLFLFTQSRQRRSAVYGFAVFALILGVASAAYALGSGNLHFLTQLGENMRLSLAPGYSSDPSPANPESFGFLNLQVLAWRIPHLGARAGAFAWTITSLLGFALLACLSRRKVLGSRGWTVLAILALLTLLPGYHRTYDRVIMLLIVPAALDMLELGPAWAAAMMALTGLWIDSDVLFLQVLRRFRETPVSPVLELALCILLLVSLLVQRKLARVAGQAPV